MNGLEFPSQADIKRIYSTTPFEKLNGLLFDSLNRSTSENDISSPSFKKVLETKEFIWQLHYRLIEK